MLYMKAITSNIRKGEVKVTVESSDDLWYLSTLIEPGDLVSGKTLRKIKVGSSEKEAVRKPVFMMINVEKVEFSKTTSSLRILGTIVEGPDDVPKGAHHSFNVDVGTRLVINKPKWFSYQIDRLKEAAQSKFPKILICVFDREDAFFALMTRTGYKLLAKIKGDVAKKDVDTKPKGGFYEKIIKQLEEYKVRYKLDRIILASPAFWKEELFKFLKNNALKEKIIQATCSSVDESAITEVLKREETKEALKLERISKEINLVEQVLQEISKDGKAVYGLKETKQAAELGAVEILLIVDELIREYRQENNFEMLEGIMKSVDNARGKVVIITGDHEGGKKLKGLGGIAGLLRFKLSY
ncbi:mRNA surveillance protein pelota [Candidatus Woesearchaeota archaeon]|nr:mRNA surveillance protein pelota [Candidatus Woesearchaeota archaeon]